MCVEGGIGDRGSGVGVSKEAVDIVSVWGVSVAWGEIVDGASSVDEGLDETVVSVGVVGWVVCVGSTLLIGVFNNTNGVGKP